MIRKIVFILIVLLPLFLKAQTYDPTKAGTALNKGIAVRGLPLDARSYFYDANAFLYRPFNSTSEVLTYFNTSTSRIGNFPIYITIGGVRRTYMFRDGTADGNLVVVDNIDVTAGVNSVNGQTGVAVLTKSDIGLPNVTNESKATMFSSPTFTGTVTLPSGTILNSPKLNTTSTLNYVWTASGTDGSGSWQPTQAIGGTVTTVNGQSGAVTLDKNSIGLGNADNTSDANKPISNATQAALNNKQALISTGTSGQYFRGDLSLATLNAAAVGLGNVTNTSDANKPVSTAQQAALDLKANLASPTFTGTLGGSPTIGNSWVFPSTITQNSANQTLTNKVINGSSNTFSNIGALGFSAGASTVSATFSTGTGASFPMATHTTAGAVTGATLNRIDSNYYAYQSSSGVGSVYFVDAQNIRYKTLIAGSGITITNNGDSSNTIAASAGVSQAFQTLTDGATVTFDCNNGTNAKLTIGGNRTLAFTNSADGTYITLVVTQDATGSRTLTLPAGSKVINGGNGALTLSTTANAIDVISGFRNGSTWYFSYGKNFN